MNKVAQYLQAKKFPGQIIYLEQSSATVDLAAIALHEPPELIAKTLAFKTKEKNIVIVTSGKARIDNKKFKEYFSCKAKMLKPDETLQITGHPVGGVCPFALPMEVEIFLDKSLQHFAYVYPAAGTTNSAIKMTPQEIHKLTNAQWIDISE